MTTTNQLVPPEVKELALKVWTPIMSFVYFFFALIATVIFIAKATSDTFAFDIAIWVWFLFALGFAVLSGVIMYKQSGTITKRKTNKQKPKPQSNASNSASGSG